MSESIWTPATMAQFFRAARQKRAALERMDRARGVARRLWRMRMERREADHEGHEGESRERQRI